MTPSQPPRSKMKKQKKMTELEVYRDALFVISKMGADINPEIIDWKNIGKNAVHHAEEVLRHKCPRCGK